MKPKYLDKEKITCEIYQEERKIITNKRALHQHMMKRKLEET